MTIVLTSTDQQIPEIPRLEMLPRGAIYHLPAENGYAVCGADVAHLPETLRRSIQVQELCPACRVAFERGR